MGMHKSHQEELSTQLEHHKESYNQTAGHSKVH